MNYLNRLFSLLFAMGLAIALTGCDYGDVEITNLTPDALPENPSNVYTIQAVIRAQTAQVVEGSIRPKIVIGGQTHPMSPSHLRPDMYEFEYTLPDGQQDASYYFLADYKIDNRGFVKEREAFSQMQSFRLINRYVYALDVSRAPVGASVGVVGRGFRRGDVVTVGGAEAPTTFNSSNSITFHVPSVPAGQNYEVRLEGEAGQLNLGTLRVDAGRINVAPESISIREGERAVVVFSVSTAAPPGGLFLDVTTDIPDSIIMPEVVVPAGARSVNVTVEGAERDEGHIWVEMPGYQTVRVPVRVR